jgi:zinc transporter, ZIP family
MLEALFWGLVTASSLWLGAAIASYARPSQKMIGLAMAFGAGALIAAVAYELVIDAFESDLRLATIGFACGGLTFYVGDVLIGRMGGEGRKSMTGQSQLAGSASAIVLGTVLDGIPESFVLGSSLLEEGAVPIAVVVGVFVSNVPEALSGSAGLLQAGWTRRRVFRMWTYVVAASVAATVLGFELVDELGSSGRAFVTAYAAGALIVMLADTLMPEAFELGGREAGLLTALGFAVGFGLS